MNRSTTGLSASRPKIAIVVSHPIQHFCPMYRSLARDPSWEVMVFFASAAGLRQQLDPGFGVEIRWEGMTLDFPHRFLNDAAVLPSDTSLDAPELDAALAAFDPNVLVLYGYAQRLQKRALAWGRRAQRAMFMISDSEARRRQSLLKATAKRVLLPRLYSSFTGFLSVGDANESYYQSFGVPPQKLYRCPFPIDREYFESVFKDKAKHRREVRAALGVPDDSLLCGVVGKLVPWKRQQDLIDAVRHLENADCRATALIIGAGSDLEQLKSAAATLKSNRVVFSGFVQPTELPRLYSALDVYVHTSSHEPHSLAISEAIYMGCPVVLSDRCGSYGPTDDVQPGRNGVVYACGDTRKLADALARLALNPRLREDFANASRATGAASQDRAHGQGLAAALRGSAIL